MSSPPLTRRSSWRWFDVVRLFVQLNGRFDPDPGLVGTGREVGDVRRKGEDGALEDGELSD